MCAIVVLQDYDALIIYCGLSASIHTNTPSIQNSKGCLIEPHPSHSPTSTSTKHNFKAKKYQLLHCHYNAKNRSTERNPKSKPAITQSDILYSPTVFTPSPSSHNPPASALQGEPNSVRVLLQSQIRPSGCNKGVELRKQRYSYIPGTTVSQ